MAVQAKDFAVDFGLEAAIGKKLLLLAEAGVDQRHAVTTGWKTPPISG